MNDRDMAILVRTVRALCPAQKFDEFTPDAWMLVIGDMPFDEASTAVRTLARQQPFIGPSDIVSEIGKARRSRASFPPGTAQDAIEADIPDADPDDVRAYIAALRAGRHRSTEGLQHRPVQQMIETSFVRVESAWSRHTIAAPRAIEAPKPDDPDFDQAREVLAAIPVHVMQDCLIDARTELETEGVPLDTRAVIIRAADIATRPETRSA